MSFASILSEPADEMPPRRASPPAPTPSVAPAKKPEPAAVLPLPRLEKKPSQEKRQPIVERDEKPVLQPRENGTKDVLQPAVQARPPKAPRLTQRDIEAIERKIAEIDRADKSDVEDDSGFEADYQLFIARSKKRAMEADIAESHKCKVRVQSSSLLCRPFWSKDHLTNTVYQNYSAVAMSSFSNLAQVLRPVQRLAPSVSERLTNAK